MKSVEYDILTADNADDMTAKVNAARAGGWRRCCDLAVTPLGMLVQQVFRFAGDHPGVRGESKLICARSADELTLQENRLVGQGWDLIPSLKAGADGTLYVWMERADDDLVVDALSSSLQIPSLLSVS